MWLAGLSIHKSDTIEAYLCFVIPTWLYTRLGVSNLLEYATRVLQVLREEVLLISNLGQKDSKLVAHFADSIVISALAPLAQLIGDALGFTSSRFVGSDRMILGLDELVQFLGELRLLNPSQTAHGEAMFGSRLLPATALMRAN